MLTLPFFKGETITILRTSFTGREDEWGNAIKDETPIVVENVMIRTMLTKDMTNAIETTMNTSLLMILPEGTEVEPDDFFLVRGTRWENDGNPDYMFPTMNSQFLPTPVLLQIRQTRGDR